MSNGIHSPLGTYAKRQKEHLTPERIKTLKNFSKETISKLREEGSIVKLDDVHLAQTVSWVGNQPTDLSITDHLFSNLTTTPTIRQVSQRRRQRSGYTDPVHKCVPITKYTDLTNDPKERHLEISEGDKEIRSHDHEESPPRSPALEARLENGIEKTLLRQREVIFIPNHQPRL